MMDSSSDCMDSAIVSSSLPAAGGFQLDSKTILRNHAFMRLTLEDRRKSKSQGWPIWDED